MFSVSLDIVVRDIMPRDAVLICETAASVLDMSTYIGTVYAVWERPMSVSSPYINITPRDLAHVDVVDVRGILTTSPLQTIKDSIEHVHESYLAEMIEWADQNGLESDITKLFNDLGKSEMLTDLREPQ
ncbi:MAG: hypothetical protein LBH28_07125 [Oscillospiraceae bacterium]|nr:hypothetical protein [Oscillospiraceae bacterium]